MLRSHLLTCCSPRPKQEDYETFKGQVEEKADRQDDMASTLEDAQARLEEAEANIAAITTEMESSAEETRVRYSG